MSLGLLALSVSWLDWADEVSARASITCFLVISSLRHAYLFATFKPHGIAPWLKARWGSEQAFSFHESLLAGLMFAQRLSFLQVLYATSQAPTGIFQALLVAAGVLMIVAGLGVSIWAARVIGIDTYHYRDLYMGPPYVSVEMRGPYAFLRNPIYGLGQLPAYGAALLALSPLGLVAAVLNQVMLYLFNDSIEQPRLHAATAVSVEWQLRHALSRTLPDDPDSALLPRRASRPPARIRRGPP